MPADRVRWVKWWAAVALLIEISFGCAARPDPAARPSAFHPTALSAHRIDHVPFVPGEPGSYGVSSSLDRPELTFHFEVLECSLTSQPEAGSLVSRGTPVIRETLSTVASSSM